MHCLEFLRLNGKADLLVVTNKSIIFFKVRPLEFKKPKNQIIIHIFKKLFEVSEKLTEGKNL